MLLSFFQWLEQNGLIGWIGQSLIISIIFEVTHYFSFFIFIGGVVLIDLRLLGMAARSQTPTQLADRIFPWVWVTFSLNFVTGFFMLSTDAVQFYSNVPFRVAMLIVALAVVFTVILQRNVRKWDQPEIPAAAKLVAVLSIVLWLGSILASVEVPSITNVG
jgi:hypothetical protein